MESLVDQKEVGMNAKLLITFTILIVMIASACGSGATAATPTLTQAETQIIPITGATETETPVKADVTGTSTVISTATPDFTSTPVPVRPTNAPDCTNKATFVADVTVPDNSEVKGNTTFIKTWRIMNIGTCVWAYDYTLRPYTEESMSAPPSVPLAITYPGQTLDVSVLLTAPNVAGIHKGYFVIRNPVGAIMKINADSRLWVIINVTSAVAVLPTAAGPAVTGIPNTPSGGGVLAGASCAFTLDQAKVNDVVNAVNAYRAQTGMKPYTVNSQLTSAAQAHANDMACNQLFGHAGSDGSTAAVRIAASGYIAGFATENVYGSYPPLSGQEAVNWWKNDKTDPRHNLNLVSDTFIEIGVGYAFFDNYGYYVIVFGTP